MAKTNRSVSDIENLMADHIKEGLNFFQINLNYMEVELLMDAGYTVGIIEDELQTEIWSNCNIRIMDPTPRTRAEIFAEKYQRVYAKVAN